MILSGAEQNDFPRRVRSATRWVAAAQVVSQLVSLLVLAALFRLVDQNDFGLMGMAVPLVLLLRSLASSGLNVAAVQREQLSTLQASSLFWLHVALGIVVAAAATACGPLLAIVYGAPRVTAVCAALAGTSLVAALGVQHQALLERNLRLGRLAIVRLLAQLAGGVAGVSAAWCGWGVWALVVQQYAELAVLAAGLWLAEPFRPRWPGQGESIRPLLQFSGWYGLSGLMFAVAQNLDKILLAVLLGATRSGQAVLGMYTQAYNLMMKPVYLISTPLSSVMLPALSRALTDRGTYQRLLARFYRVTGIALLPCGFGLFVVAEDLMLLLGGSDWTMAGRILQALAPAILVLGSINIAGSVLSSAGRADRLALGSIGFALAVAAGLAGGVMIGRGVWERPLGPALGAAWGVSATLVLAVFPVYMAFCAKTVRVSLRNFLGSQLRPFVAAAGMGLLVWAMRRFVCQPGEMSATIQLIVLVATGVAAYVAFAWNEIRWLRRELSAD